MSILEWAGILGVAFSVAYSIHMSHKLEEATMELKRASCRMRQINESFDEEEDMVNLELRRGNR